MALCSRSDVVVEVVVCLARLSMGPPVPLMPWRVAFGCSAEVATCTSVASYGLECRHRQHAESAVALCSRSDVVVVVVCLARL